LRKLYATMTAPVAEPCRSVQNRQNHVSSQVHSTGLCQLCALFYFILKKAAIPSAAWSEELWQTANGLPSFSIGCASGPLKLALTWQESLRSIPQTPLKEAIRQTPSVSPHGLPQEEPARWSTSNAATNRASFCEAEFRSQGPGHDLSSCASSTTTPSARSRSILHRRIPAGSPVTHGAAAAQRETAPRLHSQKNSFPLTITISSSAVCVR
jgi:hypothetical protein